MIVGVKARGRQNILMHLEITDWESCENVCQQWRDFVLGLYSKASLRDAIENKLTRHVWTSKEPREKSIIIPEEFQGFELIDRHHVLAYSSTSFVAIPRRTLSFFSQDVKKFQAPLFENLPQDFDVNFNIRVMGNFLITALKLPGDEEKRCLATFNVHTGILVQMETNPPDKVKEVGPYKYYSNKCTSIDTDPELLVCSKRERIILRRPRHIGETNIHVFEINPETGRFRVLGWIKNGCLASMDYILCSSECGMSLINTSDFNTVRSEFPGLTDCCEVDSVKKKFLLTPDLNNSSKLVAMQIPETKDEANSIVKNICGTSFHYVMDGCFPQAIYRGNEEVGRVRLMKWKSTDAKVLSNMFLIEETAYYGNKDRVRLRIFLDHPRASSAPIPISEFNQRMFLHNFTPVADIYGSVTIADDVMALTSFDFIDYFEEFCKTKGWELS